ncbi:MAG: 2-hydroxyacyl-CoA dehydratase subunit D [Bacillota bacterium]
MSGKSVESLGWLCSYTPVELIHAAGISPLRLIPDRAGGAGADALLARSFCPYVRAVLDEKPTAVATAVSCDCMRRLLDAIPFKAITWVPRLAPPLDPERQAAALAWEFKGFWLQLHELIGKPVPPEGEAIGAIQKSAQLYADIRAQLRMLHGAAQARNLRFSQLHRYAVAAFTMPPEEALTWLKARRPDPNRVYPGGAAVLLTGTNLLDGSAISLVEEAGGSVADVDSCLWTRWASPPANALAPTSDGQSLDGLLRRLASEYLSRQPCPREVPASVRAQSIYDSARATGATGVIHMVPKFCDVGLYEAAVVKKVLESRSMPCLLVQIEYGWGNTGQARTRVEAFLEMLRKDSDPSCWLQG